MSSLHTSQVVGGPGPVSAGELGDLVTRTQEKRKGTQEKERVRESEGDTWTHS